MKRENTATIKDGIKVKIENKETYFKFVCDPDLFFFSSRVKSKKILKN